MTKTQFCLEREAQLRYHVGIGKRGKKADIFAFSFSQNEFFTAKTANKNHTKKGVSQCHLRQSPV